MGWTRVGALWVSIQVSRKMFSKIENDLEKIGWNVAFCKISLNSTLPNEHVLDRFQLFIHQKVNLANTIPNVLTIRGSNFSCCRLLRLWVRYDDRDASLHSACVRMWYWMEPFMLFDFRCWTLFVFELVCFQAMQVVSHYFNFWIIWCNAIMTFVSWYCILNYVC
jgi:hypothetical protein